MPNRTKPTEQREELWRVPRVARALDVSPQKVYLMCAAEEIACVRIGRSVRVPASEVARLLGSNG